MKKKVSLMMAKEILGQQVIMAQISLPIACWYEKPASSSRRRHSLSIVGASALFFIRRRRKPLLVLEEEEVNFDGSPRSQFVEMKGYDVGRMA